MEKSKKLSLWTLVMLIFVPTFGFRNVTFNAVALGPASIPSWLIVALLFFLPLSAFIAELASANKERGGGIYSWIDSGLGEKWAFIGTWSYFIANLFYLQFVFSRIPVIASWAIFGENRFNDANTYLLPYMGIALCIILTWVATKGVRIFSKLSDVGGRFTIIMTFLFIVGAFLGVLFGKPSATEFTAESVIPNFNFAYFATFSWLLLAVAGAEVAGTYIDEVDQPQKNFPRGVFIATAFVAIAYVVGSIALCLVASPEIIKEAGLKDAEYVVYKMLAENFGLPAGLIVQFYALVLVVTGIAAYVVWMESPIRAMFADVPEGTFPKFLTKKDNEGSLTNALWTQCLVVVILIAIPLLGLESIDKFFRLITDLSSLSLVIPYIVLVAAYLAFRHKGKEAPFTMFKSNQIAYVVAGITFFLSIAGFFGAGLDYFMAAESTGEGIKLVLQTYGGPIILIIAGYAITLVSKRLYLKKLKK